MFGTTWAYKSYKCTLYETDKVFGENLVSELRYAAKCKMYTRLETQYEKSKILILKIIKC